VRTLYFNPRTSYTCISFAGILGNDWSLVSSAYDLHHTNIAVQYTSTKKVSGPVMQHTSPSPSAGAALPRLAVQLLHILLAHKISIVPRAMKELTRFAQVILVC
jgi:hypothetical protein